jgi:histidyl-tRNA synthetase
MRDILPEQMVRRQYVIDEIRKVFEEFGFEPLQTPAIELEETLSGKYGGEAERLIYSTTYGRGEERLSMRYDLSVPLCRVVGMYPELPKPIKRYQIAPVWRADRPQKGRYREFYQCDADTVGSTSMLGDAETIAMIYTILYRLGFREFTIYINNRKILKGLGKYAGVPDGLLPGLYKSIDKLSKIGVDGVREEMLQVGIPDTIIDSLRRVVREYLQGKMPAAEIGERLRQEQVQGDMGVGLVDFPEEVAAVVEGTLKEIVVQYRPGEIESERVQEEAGKLITGVTAQLRQVYADRYELIPEQVVDRMMPLLETEGDNQQLLASLSEKLSRYPDALQGIEELQEMFRYLELLEVPERYCQLAVSMVRGLEYYTGPIYETIVEQPNVGSITGGGRYDNLIGLFTDRSLPATGTTIGIERLIVIMEENDMFPPSIGRTITQVMVTAFSEDLLSESIKTAVDIRKAGLRTQVYFDPDPLREQIGYAAAKQIPTLVIIGPDEAEQGLITVRDLRTKQQATMPKEKAIRQLQQWLWDM